MPTQTAIQPAPLPAATPARKPFIRRHLPDTSQRLRHTIQIAFLALNAWLGLQFYLWVRFYETNGRSLHVSRPAGVEGWFPIAAAPYAFTLKWIRNSRFGP